MGFDLSFCTNSMYYVYTLPNYEIVWQDSPLISQVTVYQINAFFFQSLTI